MTSVPAAPKGTRHLRVFLLSLAILLLGLGIFVFGVSMESTATANGWVTARGLREVRAPGNGLVSLASRAYLGNFGQFNYSASKGGLVGMTRALALQLAPKVRVNAVAPSLTASEMTLAMPEKVLNKMIASIPMGRMGEPEEIAATVAALASNDMAYVTGQVVVACGGRSLAP